MEAQPVPQIPAPVVSLLSIHHTIQISTTLSSPALKAALESPVSVSTDCSPKENSPETPLSTNGNALSDSSVAAFNAVPSTTAPIPTSYADYLSLGLNPAMSIPAPVPYGSIYDIYGNYQQDYSGKQHQNLKDHKIKDFYPSRHRPTRSLQRSPLWILKRLLNSPQLIFKNCPLPSSVYHHLP